MGSASSVDDSSKHVFANSPVKDSSVGFSDNFSDGVLSPSFDGESSPVTEVEPPVIDSFRVKSSSAEVDLDVLIPGSACSDDCPSDDKSSLSVVVNSSVASSDNLFDDLLAVVSPPLHDVGLPDSELEFPAYVLLQENSFSAGVNEDLLELSSLVDVPESLDGELAELVSVPFAVQDSSVLFPSSDAVLLPRFEAEFPAVVLFVEHSSPDEHGDSLDRFALVLEGLSSDGEATELVVVDSSHVVVVGVFDPCDTADTASGLCCGLDFCC